MVWWSILVGRIVLREVMELPPYVSALYCFWRGFDQVRQSHAARMVWRPFALGGVALGAAQYVHTIPRGLFSVFILFGIYLLIFQRDLFKRAWRGIIVLIIVAEVIAAPLLIYATLHPNIDNLPSLGASQYDPDQSLLDRIGSNLPIVLGQFTFAGDTALEFNSPGRPIFEPITAILFVLGIVLAVWRVRQPEYAFALLALSVSLLPSIVLDSNFTFARMLSAQALTFAFVGIGADTLGRGMQRVITGRAYSIALATALMVVFGINLISTVRDMFIAWPAQPDTKAAFNAEFIQLGQYLDRQPQGAPISECVLWIIYPSRPRYHASLQQDALQHVTVRRDLDIRWQDCRYALVIPSGGQFIFAHPDLQPLSNFAGRFIKKPWLQNPRPIDGLSGAVQIDVRSALAQKQIEWNQLALDWPPEAIVTGTAHLPINFDRTVELIGYSIKPQAIKAGENLAVITDWRVLGPVPDDLMIFSHVYRSPDQVLAQQDQLDVSGASLQVGDIFIQQHEFITIPPDTPAGSYWIGVGLYHRDTGQRLPIEVGDQPAADRIFLGQVQVQP